MKKLYDDKSKLILIDLNKLFIFQNSFYGNFSFVDFLHKEISIIINCHTYIYVQWRILHVLFKQFLRPEKSTSILLLIEVKVNLEYNMHNRLLMLYFS